MGRCDDWSRQARRRQLRGSATALQASGIAERGAGLDYRKGSQTTVDLAHASAERREGIVEIEFGPKVT